MLRTIYVAAAVILYFIVSILFHMPIILMMDKKKGIEKARNYGRIWGKYVIKRTGSSVEMNYKNLEAIEALKDEPVVLVSNHQSHMDIPMLIGYFPKYLGFVAKKEMETWPVISMWMKRIQCVFLDRKNPREGIKSIQEAVEKIKNGYSVVIFPEGTRSKTGEIGEFKKGSFKLASDAKVKIIPVSIKGTIDVMGRDKALIKKGSIKVYVDEPVDPNIMDREEQKALSETIRNIIVENYNKL